MNRKNDQSPVAVRTENRAEDGIRLSIRLSAPVSLRKILEKENIRLDYPCGGRGQCGRCTVFLKAQGTGPFRPVRACQEILKEDSEILIPFKGEIYAEGRRNFQIGPDDGKNGLCAVCDIGTTTIVLDLYDEENGNPVSSLSMDNPGGIYSQDVVGRIQASMDGKREEIRRMMEESLIALADRSRGRQRIRRWIITGNTAMLYLMTGRDPAGLSRAPFIADHLFDETITLDGRTAYLPPCLAAYAGADLTCALLFSAFDRKSGVRMLCDLGTNAEIALWKNGRGYVTSAAAGSALEGIGIRRGISAIPGAIRKVMIHGGKIMTETVGDEKPRGICGSGLIDSVFCALQTGTLRKDGYMSGDLELANGISLYPDDVRKIQAAKAAVRAGIEMLLRISGTSENEVQEFLFCGGFGNRINPISAAGIGMIPYSFLKAAHPAGNAALAGAAMLRTEDEKERLRHIVRSLKYVGLAGDEKFGRLFLENMDFPETN